MISTSESGSAAPSLTCGVSASHIWGAIGIRSPRFQVGIWTCDTSASAAAVVAPESGSATGFGGSASASGAAYHTAVESVAGVAWSTPSIGTMRTVVRRGDPETGNCTTEIVPVSCVLDAGRRNRFRTLRGSSSAVAASGMFSGAVADPNILIS
jgi:hypothetical protein